MSEEVLTERRDGVGIVTLNRPEARNALNRAVREGIPRAIAELDADPDIGAIVLTGADPAFCAGLDLKELASAPGGGAGTASAPKPFGPTRVPVIGAVNGVAVTGGLELALACDFLIASEAARFADTHARVGVVPGWGLTVDLPERVGLTRARQMSFTGNYVDAELALAWGLVNEVVPHGEVVDRAVQLGRDMATTQRPTLEAIRDLYDDGGELARGEARELEGERNRAWMKTGFSRDELATSREQIQARGSNQV